VIDARQCSSIICSKWLLDLADLRFVDFILRVNQVHFTS